MPDASNRSQRLDRAIGMHVARAGRVRIGQRGERGLDRILVRLLQAPDFRHGRNRFMHRRRFGRRFFRRSFGGVVLAFGGKQRPVNQDAIVQHIGFYGNNTLANPLHQAKLITS